MRKSLLLSRLRPVRLIIFSVTMKKFLAPIPKTFSSLFERIENIQPARELSAAKECICRFQFYFWYIRQLRLTSGIFSYYYYSISSRRRKIALLVSHTAVCLGAAERECFGAMTLSRFGVCENISSLSLYTRSISSSAYSYRRCICATARRWGTLSATRT